MLSSSSPFCVFFFVQISAFFLGKSAGNKLLTERQLEAKVCEVSFLSCLQVFQCWIHFPSRIREVRFCHIKHQRFSFTPFLGTCPFLRFFNFLPSGIHHSLPQAAIRKYSDGLEWLEDLDHATGTQRLHCTLDYTILYPPKKSPIETIIRYDLKDLKKFTLVLAPLCLHIKAAMCVWPCGRTVAKRVCSAACGSRADKSAEQKTSLIWRFAVFWCLFVQQIKNMINQRQRRSPSRSEALEDAEAVLQEDPGHAKARYRRMGSCIRVELVFLGSKCSDFGEVELSKQIPCHFQVCESLVWTWAASRSCCRVAATGWQQWGDAEMCQKIRK